MIPTEILAVTISVGLHDSGRSKWLLFPNVPEFKDVSRGKAKVHL